MLVAAWGLAAIGLYLLFGALFATAFVVRGVERIDAAARGAPWFFRALIFPGVTALWPLLLRRWWSAAAREQEENAP